MSGELFRCDVLFGHVQIKQFHRVENGRMNTYNYSIEYDRNGIEVSRTKPEVYSSIGWDSGEPFAEEDYLRLKLGG